MGNEYLTAACADTKIMHFVKIVEGGDKPEEGSDSKKQFEGEIDSNISALVARICICIYWFGQSCHSQFGLRLRTDIRTVVELLEFGLFSTYVIKKKKG